MGLDKARPISTLYLVAFLVSPYRCMRVLVTGDLLDKKLHRKRIECFIINPRLPEGVVTTP